jgi:glycosyltransferase involved in cell wall biosynthesis
MVPVSVVVPAYNAERTIDRAIPAILNQDYPPARYELIVVDNASTDRTPAIVARFAPRARSLREPRPGASAARNAGIRAARHPYIAFTDADCIPDRSWLRELVAAATGPLAADFVGGRIVAHATQSPIETFAESLMDQERAVCFYHPPSAITANLMVRRDLLHAVGLFDESLRRGQDVDLSYRAYFRHRATFAYAERAVVRHVNPRTMPALFRKGVQHGQAVVGVLHKHAGDLGKTPWQRCVDRRRYATILAATARFVWWTCRRPINRDAALEAARMEALCRAVFDTGKQLGVLVATARVPRGRPRRSLPA